MTPRQQALAYGAPPVLCQAILLLALLGPPCAGGNSVGLATHIPVQSSAFAPLALGGFAVLPHRLGVAGQGALLTPSAPLSGAAPVCEGQVTSTGPLSTGWGILSPRITTSCVPGLFAIVEPAGVWAGGHSGTTTSRWLSGDTTLCITLGARDSWCG